MIDMPLRELNGIDLKGKRILVRIDGNVPVKNGKVQEGKQGKLARAAVDLEWLRQHGARIMVLTHRGRPDGKRVSAYSVQPIARRLSELLGEKVRVVPSVVGKAVERAVGQLKDGDLLLLENVRFDPREERNSPSLARALAKFSDMYINDAFAVSHRAHTSVDAITSELPSYAGPLLANEVAVLQKATRAPKHPVVLVMGGLKMETKLPILKRFLPDVKAVLFGGALATAFLKARGYEVGHSVYDEGGVKTAAAFLKRWSKKIFLPIDVVVAKSFRANGRARMTSVTDIRLDEVIVDVGKETIRAYQEKLKEAKTIIWNGPFGYCEQKRFCRSTEEVARAIAARTGKAVTIVGGGDTVPVLETLGLGDHFTLLSTGGGAMLEFLAGKELPGVKALEI